MTKHFDRGPTRGNGGTYVSAGYRDAVDLDDAILGIKRRNARARIDQRAAKEALVRSKITLSPILDEWLKKVIP